MDEQDLNRMNRVLRHRLRNFASGIKSATTFLSKELEGRLAPQEMEYFPLLLKECDDLTELTARMNLLFDETPPGGPASCADLLASAAARLHERFPTTGLDLAAGEGLPIMAQAQWVLIPLLEVLVNAAEAAPARPIRLEAQLQSASLVFRVRDQGPGIPEAEIAACFKPFHTTRARHLGIGLPVAVRWAARLGGEMKAEREPAGGLLCTLRWPLERVAVQQDGSEPLTKNG